MGLTESREKKSTRRKSTRKFAGKTVCAICLDVIKKNAKIISCNHRFCLECITQWYAREKTCPCCRKTFEDDELDAELEKAKLLFYASSGIESGIRPDDLDDLVCC